MAKSSKKAGKKKSKIAKKAVKAAGRKAASKKAAGKKKAGKKAPKKAARKAATLGCCTLTGSGPDQQIERITREECRLLAIQAGKDDHWVAGECAEPS